MSRHFLHARGAPPPLADASRASRGALARGAWPQALPLTVLVLLHALVSFSTLAQAQILSNRGFVETRGFLYPQDAPNDPTNAIADVLVREELFVKPTSWLQAAVGVDLRGNSHDQVDDRWRIDFADRTAKRPLASVRRLNATVARGPFTIDAGKQFIRWGKTDIVTPTDRFAPRDFLNVVDAEFLAVTGARIVAQAGSETFDVVWVPRFTPSRIPLVTDRWTAVPAGAARIPIVDAGAVLPAGSEAGVRWSHLGAGLEYSLSLFDGFNHLPDIDSSIRFGPAGAPVAIDIERRYPPIRTYGGDAAWPTRWFTLKAEAAYFTSQDPHTDEYVLYVVQMERQTGEWAIVGGYAGEVVTSRRALLTFAPDRGVARSIVARAAYTIDPNRSVAVETSVRQNGRGAYVKGEYSRAYGQHWRATGAAALVAGHSDDFLGQYHRNSYATAALRYSF